MTNERRSYGIQMIEDLYDLEDTLIKNGDDSLAYTVKVARFNIKYLLAKVGLINEGDTEKYTEKYEEMILRLVDEHGPIMGENDA